MSATLRSEIQRESNRNTMGVVYHSRMMYLTPEDAVGVSPKKSPAKLEAYNPTKHRKQPCPEAKLVPPIELMTRPQALRFAYLANHDPRERIKKMDTLEPKVDPESERKREDIMRKMREAEIRAEMKRKEATKKSLGRAKVKAARISSLFGRESFNVNDDNEHWQTILNGATGGEEEEEDDDFDEFGASLEEHEEGGDSLDAMLGDKEGYLERREQRRKLRENMEGGGDDQHIVIHSKDKKTNTDYFNSRKTKIAPKNHFGRQHQKAFDDLALDDGAYPETFSFMNEWNDKDETTQWLKKKGINKW